MCHTKRDLGQGTFPIELLRLLLQCAMTQITLVLPFALPPPELAKDLVRALKAPALAALLARTDANTVPVDDGARALPHERWLGRRLGLEAGGQPAFARAAMRGFGLAHADGIWFIVNPAHIAISRSHLLMSDLRGLQLSEAHSRALFDVARPYFEEIGKTLLYGDAATWFMRADDWAALETSSPDSAVGQNLTDWLPQGERGLDYRKLQNEIQMLWYEHPANSEREQRGLQPVNGFWPWSPSTATPAEPALAAADDAPSWLSALARQHDIVPSQLAAGDAILLCDSLSAPAIATEWAGWLAQFQRIDDTLLAPLLAAAPGGVKLVLTRRDRHLECSTTKMAQLKFWRRPSLELLLT